MGKREVLGLVKCPECDFDGAEVKLQKNGKAYRYCPECDAQFFARTDAASDRLLAKTGAKKAPEPEPKPAPAPEVKPAPEPEPKPAPKQVKKSGFADALAFLNAGG